MEREIERTEELLHKSLKELNDKGDLNNSTLDLIGKTIDALKDICEIRDKDRSYGSHHGGMWTAEGSYGRMYGRRDGDDRYYDRMDGYGRMYGNHNDIIDDLHRDLNNASSDQEREYIRKMIRKYEM